MQRQISVCAWACQPQMYNHARALQHLMKLLGNSYLSKDVHDAIGQLHKATSMSKFSDAKLQLPGSRQ